MGSQVCSWRTIMTLIGSLVVSRMENGKWGGEKKKKRKRKKRKNSCRRTRAAQRWKKESFLWGGDFPSGFREKEIAPGWSDVAGIPFSLCSPMTLSFERLLEKSNWHFFFFFEERYLRKWNGREKRSRNCKFLCFFFSLIYIV